MQIESMMFGFCLGIFGFLALLGFICIWMAFRSLSKDLGKPPEDPDERG